MKRKALLSVLLCAIMIFSTACGSSSKEEPKPEFTLDLSATGELNTEGLELKFGELLSVIHSGNGVVVIKAKIKPSYKNEATINQNYYTVCTLINKNGFDACSEIQYWAVADMSSGGESKVISFTIDADTIKSVKGGKIVENELGNYATDLYILPSLLQ